MPQKKMYSYGRMAKDISASKEGENVEMYYDAQNLRSITADAQSTGAMSTESGNILSVTIPNIYLDKFTKPNKLVVTSQSSGIPSIVNKRIDVSNPEILALPDWHISTIVGHTRLRKRIIFITTDKRGTGTTAIWDYNALDDSINLIYYNDLQVYLHRPVREMLAIYETAAVQRIYFTDDFNPLRSLLISDPDVLNYPKDILNVVPAALLSTPLVTNIHSGGSFKSGVVQYAYQLYSTNGTITTLAPLSPLYSINELYRGLEFDSDVAISLEVQVPDIDLRYSHIKIYRLFYSSSEQEPAVDLILDESFLGVATYTYLDSGSKTISPLSLEELSVLLKYTFTCKTFDVKDAHMFLGNITQLGYYPDFDSRSYRYNSSGRCIIKDTTLPNADFFRNTLTKDTVPLEHDCINTSNDQETTQSYINSSGFLGGAQNPEYQKYIYRGDGVTIGGEGLNISYTIPVETTDPIAQATIKANTGYSLGNESYANPINFPKKSYKRDEIYRFGIELYNKNGEKSPVYWIADIRMPSSDIPGYGITKWVSGQSRLVSLYVDFTVNNLPSDCSGYRIVRVEREIYDRTIVSQGYMTSMTGYDETGDVASNTYTQHKFVQLDFLSRSVHAGFTTFRNMEHGKDLEVGSSFKDVNSYSINSRNSMFYSPELEDQGVNYTTVKGEYFKVVGGGAVNVEFTRRYRGSTSNIDSQSNFLDLTHYGDDPDDINSNFYYEWNRVVRSINTKNNVVIYPLLTGVNAPSAYAEGYIYQTQEYAFPGATTLNVDNGEIWLNAQRMIIRIKDAFKDDFSHMTSDGARALVHKLADHVDGNTSGRFLEKFVGFYNLGSSPNDTAFKIDNTPRLIIADHKITRPTQYGGNTFEARKDNNYISCSIFNPNTISGIRAKQGDITVAYYTFLRSGAFTPKNFDLGFDTGGKENFFSSKEVLILPLESSVTLDLRTDEYRTVTRDLLRVPTDMLKVNTAYEQQGNFIINRIAPREFKLEKDFSYRIMASDTKLYGEPFDAWMSYPVSQFIDVDTKHDSIHKILEFNDQLYFIQDDAIGFLSVYPRMQVAGSDGESIQLGEGDLLEAFYYLSTVYGSSLQFSASRSMAGMYIVDNYRQVILKIGPKGVEPISDMGLLKSMLVKLNWDNLASDNPYINQGIVTGFNQNSSEMLFTILQKYSSSVESGNKDIIIDNTTLAFNELTTGFTGFYSYTPTLYEFVNGFLYSTEDNSSIWKHIVGNYCNYYGVQHMASITFKMSPSGPISNIFNTLMFQSEVTIDGVDLAEDTITGIELYNDYQISGPVTVILGNNIKRRYREWRLNIPRELGTRNRMRGAWIYCKLEFDPTGNKRLILHDMVLDYTPFPASFV